MLWECIRKELEMMEVELIGPGAKQVSALLLDLPFIANASISKAK